MNTDRWNPAQYERFKAERAQPFHDLLDMVQLPSPQDYAGRSFRAADLGCGSGELTALLHARLGSTGVMTSTLGLDSSAAMLARSSEFSAPGLRFEQGDISAYAARCMDGPDVVAEALDLLFSNAALQWLDSHESLFPQLFRLIAPGGQLAVQIPCNQDHPAYALAAEVAAEPRFATALGGHLRQSPVLAPQEYALLLGRAGFAEQRVLLRVYLHRLSDRAELLEWVRGSLLTDYEKRLSAQDYSAYLARYRELLDQRVADERPCLFTFKRLLIWGRLPK